MLLGPYLGKLDNGGERIELYKPDPPDLDGRKSILDSYLGQVAHDPAILLDHLAAETAGYTPLAIKYLVNEALVIARASGRDAVTEEDLRMAREPYEWGVRQSLPAQLQATRPGGPESP